MSEGEQRQGNSERYLGAALKWLRIRLQRQASLGASAAGIAPQSRLEEPSPGWRFPGRERGSPPSEPAAAAAGSVSDADLAEAFAEMEAAEKAVPPPALVTLGQRLGLSPFERNVMLLCAATELDTRIPALCAGAQDDLGRNYPTFALALTLFDGAAWDALSPGGPLRYLRLLEINQPGGQPLVGSALRADERIVDYIRGLNHLDDRLALLVTPIETAGLPLPPSQQAIGESIVRYLRQAVSARRKPVIQLTGIDGASKRLIAAEVMAAFGRQLYQLAVETIPSQAGEREMLARLWQREAALLPVALYLDASEVEQAGPSDAQFSALRRFLTRSDGVFVVDTREACPGIADASVVFEVSTPTAAEQQTAWVRALRANAGGAPALLAGQFNLDVASIRDVGLAVLAESPPDEATARRRPWDLCRIRTRPRLEMLAQRLDAKAVWEDIVLPEEGLGLLRHIAAHVRQRSTVYDDWGFRSSMNRGLGIAALFVGESGTGKTMAAEVIANDLRLDLYRIDLSAVVSKYIGETEKNLRKVFDAAENGGAILFFDEADALFGKRSEVKDSHDRYANIEINYLLQRMEAYRGVAILATNMKNALDTAFTRRLRFIVRFQFPGISERKAIWRKVFPPKTPVAGLDFDRLARFNLTGGSIRNIALNAAFLAAASNPPRVTMPLVLDAAKAEFQKLERPINEGDFIWEAPKVAAA